MNSFMTLYIVQENTLKKVNFYLIINVIKLTDLKAIIKSKIAIIDF